MVTFLFSVHIVTEAKQYAGLGRAEPVFEPVWWIFQPGQPGVPWCSAATVKASARTKDFKFVLMDNKGRGHHP